MSENSKIKKCDALISDRCSYLTSTNNELDSSNQSISSLKIKVSNAADIEYSKSNWAFDKMVHDVLWEFPREK